MLFFFFNDTATTEIYTLSLHDAPSDLDLRDQARPDRLPYQLPLELRVLLPTAHQDVHHPRKRTPDSLLDRQAVDPPRIDVGIQTLILPPPRNAEPVLSYVSRLCHAYTIPH